MSERFSGITGRRVDFTKELPLAWGIEVDTPIGQAERAAVFIISGVKIPKRINNLKFLDLNPQESLPMDLRNIRSDFELHEHTTLNCLANGKKRLKTIGNLFGLFFWKNKSELRKYNRTLSFSEGHQIVLIEAHGDNDLLIGEQYSHDPQNWRQRKYQVEGNQIEVKKIFKKYSDSSIYSSVLLVGCYTGKKGLNPVGVPLVYVKGEMEYLGGRKRRYNINLVVPKNWTGQA